MEISQGSTTEKDNQFSPRMSSLMSYLMQVPTWNKWRLLGKASLFFPVVLLVYIAHALVDILAPRWAEVLSDEKEREREMKLGELCNSLVKLKEKMGLWMWLHLIPFSVYIKFIGWNYIPFSSYIHMTYVYSNTLM